MTAWRTDALCAQVGIEWFFSDEAGANYPEGKQLCRVCPVRLACLQQAIRNQEREGLWAGFVGRSLRKITIDGALEAITADEIRHDARQQVERDTAAVTAENRATKSSANQFLGLHRAFLRGETDAIEGERAYQRESKRLRRERFEAMKLLEAS